MKGSYERNHRKSPRPHPSVPPEPETNLTKRRAQNIPQESLRFHATCPAELLLAAAVLFLWRAFIVRGLPFELRTSAGCRIHLPLRLHSTAGRCHSARNQDGRPKALSLRPYGKGLLPAALRAPHTERGEESETWACKVEVPHRIYILVRLGSFEAEQFGEV